MANTNRSRIPVKIADFSGYLTSSDDYLKTVTSPGPPPVTNGTRLGLQASDVTAWTGYRTQWDTIYAAYNNPNTRTATVTQQVNNLIATFREFAQPLLNLMAASPSVSEYDEQALNFKADRKPPTRPTVPIAEECISSASSLGGGQVKFSSRTDHDTARASLADGADSVQYAYKVGDQAPANPDDTAKTIIATRANSIQPLGADVSGKKLHYYARWYNTKYPQFAGPWSEMMTVVLT